MHTRLVTTNFKLTGRFLLQELLHRVACTKRCCQIFYDHLIHKLYVRPLENLSAGNIPNPATAMHHGPIESFRVEYRVR